MSVIAWDGKTLAADKQATCAGMRFTTTKLRRLSNGAIMAWTADQDSAEMVARWYADLVGTKGGVETWPECQKDKDRWARLIVWEPWDKRLVMYEREPICVVIEDPFMAWGSGRDYAMGAMARGATAREAVEIACRFETGCGMGMDAFDIDPQFAANGSAEK